MCRPEGAMKRAVRLVTRAHALAAAPYNLTKTGRQLHRHGCLQRQETSGAIHHEPQPPRASGTTIQSMMTRGIEHHYMEDFENLEYYRPGGLHPVEIGNVFKLRYRVVAKLGYGTYSTTWLARDTLDNSFVAVKVRRADSDSQETDVLALLNEAWRLQHQADASLSATRRAPIPPLLDTFTVTGPNGTHPCYVTLPASSSINWTTEEGFGVFQKDVSRVIAAQLVRAVASLHSAKFVHGDLHLGNILFRLPTDLNHPTDEELYDTYNKPFYEPVYRLDGEPVQPNVPSHAVSTIWFGKSSAKLTLQDARIFLCDFGESFSPLDSKKTESRAPLVYRPPETFFAQEPLSFPSDIWMLACCIWNLLGPATCFFNFLGTQDETICSQVDLLGPLPPAWSQKWAGRDKYFAEDGARKSGQRMWEPMPLAERFDAKVQEYRRMAGIATFCVEEKKAILSMLKPMLSYLPEDRPTAEKILESE